MREQDLREAIQRDEIESITFYGRDAGWECWASPAPRGCGERLHSALGHVRVFRTLDAAEKLTRALGWKRSIKIDGTRFDAAA